MSSAEIVTIADGVTALINDATFSQEVDATRSWRPSYSLDDLKTTRVCVTPRANEEINAGRDARQEDYRVEIGTLKKVDPADNADVDALALLTEELRNLLRDSSIVVGSAQAHQVQTEITYDPDFLTETRQFISMLAVTYRLLA